MNLEGQYEIQADRESVWKLLMDPNVLAQCIPGCEEIVQNTPTQWSARILAKVGPVKARFDSNIQLTDLQEPASLCIVGEGKGGAAGFASGSSKVILSSHNGNTILQYDSEVQLGGKLMQIGARLINSFARKFADDFFRKFSEIAGAGVVRNIIDSTPTDKQAAAPSHETTQIQGQGNLPPHYSPPDYPPAYGHSRKGFDAQSFTIVVLALLLAFMVVMYAYK